MKGNKNNKRLYEGLIKKSIPNKIELYVEPFGGEFGLYELINKPTLSVYNDIDNKKYKLVYNKYKHDNSINFFNTDYKKIIEIFDTKNTFFFCDPPYWKHYEYRYNFTDEQHIELSNILKKIKGKFLLCYHNDEFITNLYKKYKIDRYIGPSFVHKPEITIKNY